MKRLIFHGIAGISILAVFLGMISCSGGGTSPPKLPPSTQIVAFGSQPRWSPNGQLLGFGGSGANAGIWIWNSQSGGLTRIVDSSHPHNYDYRWWIGSDQIVFSGAGATIDSTAGIYTVNADGSNLIRRHPTGKHPDWIPDGSGLIFEEDNPQSSVRGIFRLVFATNDKIQITTEGHQPQINSTGTLIAFLSPNPGLQYPNFRLKAVPLSGGAVGTLSDSCLSFVWTTDGVSVLYDYSKGNTAGDPGTRICQIAGTGGGNPLKIVQGGSEPSVSAGGRIAHRQLTSDLSLGLFVVNLDGSGLMQLTYEGAQPSIKPDGSQVAFSTGNGIWIVTP